ncbi:uncharacterized protein LOC124290512 [Haliotis rubra]|uniref:uncharacterized protein LOC124290512 n=1 Tax=Haliotis rubra TaxID=36100 RepID=UPI001EE6083E|nr:uncharacterized protein LOC124290512 [Haliotis rubra]
MKHCPSGQYYDEVVNRCQGCEDICYWIYQKDPDSDCNKFCPGFSQGGHPGQDGSASTPVNVPMLVSIIAGVVVVVIVLVVLWRRFRRRDQTPSIVVQETTLVAQPSDSSPEMGFAELCIGSNSGDHLLTGSDYSGN